MPHQPRTTALVAGALALAALLAAPVPSWAQPLGVFTWQLQPFCNVVTVNVVQTGAVYTLDGYDNQCGAPQRAPLVGVATPNPDGTVALGFSVVTTPGGRPVHIEARASAATLGGPWSDSAGNGGLLVFGGSAAGPVRPVPTIPATALAPGAVTTVTIADGTVGVADVDASAIQRRVAGACPTGQYLASIAVDGAPTCTPGPGDENAVVGRNALAAVTTGGANVAVGEDALRLLTLGGGNVAVGKSALRRVSTASNNIAVGTGAVSNNLTGELNIGIGGAALFNATGSSNLAFGFSAGSTVQGGDFNIHIGNVGASADANTVRIGTAGDHLRAYVAGIRGTTTVTSAIPVVVGTDGQLGTISSSRRFKHDIQDMGDLSARLFKLRPVTFRYTQAMADGSTPLDFGLIAEEVAEVFPELAVTGADGRIETVHYQKLPALLLNELQQQQRVIDAQARALATLEARLLALETELRRH